MSTVKANDLTNVTGGIPTVKGQRLIPTAWVNFNGTGTVAIRDSENVSSITDNSTGDYTVNFATTMANANYSITATGTFGEFSIRDVGTWSGTDPTTSLVRFVQRNSSGSINDGAYMCVTILGGQA